jgi:hypothetical protein
MTIQYAGIVGPAASNSKQRQAQASKPWICFLETFPPLALKCGPMENRALRVDMEKE